MPDIRTVTVFDVSGYHYLLKSIYGWFYTWCQRWQQQRPYTRKCSMDLTTCRYDDVSRQLVVLNCTRCHPGLLKWDLRPHQT